jgi:O-acetylhomoserine/O-acetylserine sulfhydrylase
MTIHLVFLFFPGEQMRRRSSKTGSISYIKKHHTSFPFHTDFFSFFLFMTHFETKAVHSGYDPRDHNQSVAVPIYQTSAYTYESAEAAAELFDLKRFGNIYTRITNPTVDVLEKRVTALERGVAALATASGHAAQFLTLSTLCENGDHFLSSSHLYGGTYNQFSVSLKKFGIKVSYFDPLNEDFIEEKIQKNTKAIYVESLANPAFSIVDFEKIVLIAKKHHIPVVVDNTVPSPALFRPLELGANIVIHSSSKILGGQGNSIGGIIVDGGNFDWGKTDRFSQFTSPSEGYHGLIFNDIFGKNGALGNIAFIVKARVEGLRDFGPCMSPFNAFLFLQGIETLSLRTQYLSKNIEVLARYLEKHPKVEAVYTPILENSPYHERFKKYFFKGGPGILSFELKGGRKKGERFVESVSPRSVESFGLDRFSH